MKKDETVVIVGCESNHPFPMGSLVKILSKADEWPARVNVQHLDRTEWVEIDDIAPIEKAMVSKTRIRNLIDKFETEANEYRYDLNASEFIVKLEKLLK